MGASERDILPKAYVNLLLSRVARLTITSRVRPKHYELSIFNQEFGGSWSYQGIVNIHLDVKEAVQEITLNAHQLQIQKAVVGSQPASDISYDDKSQRVTLAFSTELPRGEDAILEMHFTGTCNNGMAGYYR